MNELILYQYLSQAECKELMNELKRNGISSRCVPMASGDGDLDINQILIMKEDINKASGIVKNYSKLLRSKVLLEKYTCPRCKAKLPFIEYKQNVSFFLKLVTIGTKILKCKKCGKEWYV